MAEMSNAGVPKWVQKRVMPSLDGSVRSVHVMKDRGGAKSAVLFTHEGAFVAERGFFGRLRMYEVDFPNGFLLNESDCPHCGKRIREPVGKTASVIQRGRKQKKRAPAPVVEEEEEEEDEAEDELDIEEDVVVPPPRRRRTTRKRTTRKRTTVKRPPTRRRRTTTKRVYRTRRRTTTPARRTTTKRRTTRKSTRDYQRGRRSDPTKVEAVQLYIGQNHPVDDVEGLSVAHRSRLRDAGIKSTDALRAADARDVAKATRTRKGTVDRWVGMAELMSLKDIGPRFAYLLYESGIVSIAQLRKQTSAGLYRRLKDFQEAGKIRIEGVAFNQKRVTAWIAKAKAARKGLYLPNGQRLRRSG